MRSLGGDWERGFRCSRSYSGSRNPRYFLGEGIDFCKKMLYICRKIELSYGKEVDKIF